MAKTLGCVVAITGKEDVICDGTRVVKIQNGVALLSKVTGTGCMTSGLVGSYLRRENDAMTAAIAGVATMGLAGELAYETVLAKNGTVGTGSFSHGDHRRGERPYRAADGTAGKVL